MVHAVKNIFRPFCLIILINAAIGSVSRPAKFDETGRNVTEHDYEADNITSVHTDLDYRLPATVRPITYNLKLFNINFETFTYNGHVEIDVEVLDDDIYEIVLHKGELTETEISVLNVTSNSEDELTIEGTPFYDKTTEKLTIELETSLQKEYRIRIAIDFNGTLRDTMDGFYRSSYFDENKEQRWLASTFFEKTSARHAFPCFDEPALKATFSIKIEPPQGYDCLSNMPPEKSEERCNFKTTELMSTYLVAFLVSDFKSYPDDESETLKVWARPNAIEQAEYSQKLGVKVVEYFENLFKENYTLPKMDIAAIPDFAHGAMENWGLLTHLETQLLYDENESSADYQQMLAFTVAHEIAHMWFGNLVTPAWWNFMWLKEGFAEYFQYMAINEIEKTWKSDQQILVDMFQTAMESDVSEKSTPLTRSEIQSVPDLKTLIVYNKGSSIVRMMEKTFGSELFITAIQNYINTRKFGVTTSDDLWEAFQDQIDQVEEESAQIDIATIMNKWTTQPGFPVVHVNIKSDTIELRQERFSIRKLNTTSETEHWWVPITLYSSSNNNQSTKPVYWLSQSEGKIPNEHRDADWIIFNVHSAGFYRVNYDEDSWNRIIKVLNSEDFEKIHELNRAAIVDDLFKLALAEQISYKTVFRAIQYLKRERNYLPFNSALRSLDSLMEIFRTSSNYDSFREYVLFLLNDVYEEIGYDDQDSDDQFNLLLRIEINERACHLGHQKCISKSKEYFSNWRQNQKPIPKNQRSTAYCTAIRHGTDEDWEFLWDKYRESNLAHERKITMAALSCSKNSNKLEKYLMTALEGFERSNIRKPEVENIFRHVYSSNLEGAKFMLDFVQQHAEEIRQYFKSDGEIGDLIVNAVMKYPTECMFHKLDMITNSNASHIQYIKSYLQDYKIYIQSNLDRFSKHDAVISAWINESNVNRNTANSY